MFWVAAGDHIPPHRYSNIPTHTVCVCQGRKPYCGERLITDVSA